ncbi:DUF1638 domain-containing protein [Fundidesulfovibrio terrae]|uniref:DUF1638 domain-containing protein n=1 Tax=Fundidesulfovibrio terrae TaxID=2922866 RepID=UPI001FAF5109
MSHASAPAVVACGIFKKELEALGYGARGVKTVTLDSMLHMRPDALDGALDGMLSRGRPGGLALVYGDCSPHMLDFARREGVRKVQGLNCCEIVLGRERYRSLRREGAFFFMPEWAGRWEDVFKHEMGFSQQSLAREFMHDMMKRAVYLDTGVHAVPHRTLDDIASFLGMPVEVLPTGLTHLQAAVDAALAALAVDGEKLA